MDPISLGLAGLRMLGWFRKHKRALGYAAVAFAILGAFAFLALKIDQHFDGIRATETQLSVAESEAKRLNDRVSALDVTIRQNAKAYEASKQQLESARRVAEQERDAARVRAAHYERIRDAAIESPAEDRLPVSPVVADTIDRLWPDAGSGPAAGADHP